MPGLKTVGSDPLASPQRNKTSEYLEDLIKECFSKAPLFEDQDDFLLWAEEAFPRIGWRLNPALENGISVFLVCWASSESHPGLFFNSLKRQLAMVSPVSHISLQQFSTHLKDFPQKKISLSEAQFCLETPSEVDHFLHLLPSWVQKVSLEMKPPGCGSSSAHLPKLTLLHARIAKLRQRFPSKYDDQIFEESRGVLALIEPAFIEQRPPELLSRLVISQHCFRKSIFKSIAKSPDFRCLECRILCSRISSPFATKKALGIFVGLNFLHKYEIFNEEHILRALNRLQMDVQCVSGANYSFQRQSEPIKFLYIEVEKKDETSFSLEERKLLKRGLKEALSSGVEKLQPAVFKVNNEEEIVKDILLLSREVQSVSDLYQAMVHLDGQTDREVRFQIIVVYAGTTNLPEILEGLAGCTYLPQWGQIVRYLEKQCPVHAHVFKLQIAKVDSLVRSDGSLDFYAARRKVSDLLEQCLGDFRDYNGGMIIKQGELLTRFKQGFAECAAETMENFFYSLSPLEIQTTMDLATLTTFFNLFLEVKSQNLVSFQRCSANYVHKENILFCMLQANDFSFIDHIQAFIKKLHLDPKSLISSQIAMGNRVLLGYIFECTTYAQRGRLSKAIQAAMDAWEKKVVDVQTLRFAICSRFHPLDPRIQGDEDTKTILKLLFEGLMQVDSHGKVVPGLAKSVKVSSDQKKYTFQLRLSSWSNGEPVSAHDFVYAWRSVLSPHFKAPSAYLLYSVKNARAIKKGDLSPNLLGVRAAGKNKLEIELEYPTSYFLELLAQPQFSPINPSVDLSQPNWPHQEGKGYVCNGPFILRKNNPSQGYELIKNPNYHQHSQIMLDRVSIRRAPSAEIKELFFRDEIDWIGFPTRSVDLPSLPLNQGETIVLHNDSLYWYVFNTQCFPFNHVKIRQAFALTVNRARILQNISSGHWPAFTVLPFQHSRGCLMEESRKKGVELFEEALKDLHLDRKNFPILKLIHTEGKIRNSIAQIVKNDWETALGIQCQIETLDNWYEVFNCLTEGNFQICGVNWVSLIDDPSYTLQAFHSASQCINFPKWSNNKYEQFLDKANKEKRLSKRLAYLGRAEEILLKEAPVIPLIRTLPCSIKKSRLKIINHSSLRSWDFKWAFIRENTKKE